MKMLRDLFERLADVLSSNKYALAIGWCFTVGVPIITGFLSNIYVGVVLFVVLIIVLVAYLYKHPREEVKQLTKVECTEVVKEGAPIISTLSTKIPISANLIGREKAVQDIQELLAQNKIVYIHAHGGVGKTALAAEIANRVLNSVGPYKHVAWITSTGDLMVDLTKLNVPGVRSAQKLEDKINLVTEYLQTTPTFLIIDNMDYLLTRDEVNELNSIKVRTKILITTRANIRIGKPYDLGDLDLESALILFYRHYQEGKKLTIDQIQAREDYSYAQSIIASATNNALFTELIGKMAYADHWTLKDLCKKLEIDIFGQDSKHVINVEHGDDGTLLNHIQKLYEMSNISDKQKEIMSFIAFFPPEYSIFFKVFEWAGFEDDKVDNLGELQKRGWIERDDEGYLIHTLVKWSIELQSGKALFDDERYENLIVELIDTDQYIPGSMVYTKVRERIVVPETICELLYNQGCKRISAYYLCSKLSLVYLDQWNREKYQKYSDMAAILSEREHETGPTSKVLFDTEVSEPTTEKLDINEAMKRIERIQYIFNKFKGDRPTDVLKPYDNLAQSYVFQSRYEEVLRYYQQSVELREKYEKDHPDTASAYDKLGNVYEKLGRYNDALDCYKKALVIRENALAEDNPEIAISYIHLGYMYGFLKEFDIEKDFYKRALNVYKKNAVIDEEYKKSMIKSCESLIDNVNEQIEFSKIVRVTTS